MPPIQRSVNMIPDSSPDDIAMYVAKLVKLDRQLDEAQAQQILQEKISDYSDQLMAAYQRAMTRIDRDNPSNPPLPDSQPSDMMQPTLPGQAQPTQPTPSVGSKMMASWVAGECRFGKKKKKHSKCVGCGGWMGHWMSTCPGCSHVHDHDHDHDDSSHQSSSSDDSSGADGVDSGGDAGGGDSGGV